MVLAGRYELLERLGGGGMGVVYRARTIGPGGFRRTLALKSLLPELAGDPLFVALFRREARLVARLSHRCIVQVYELVDLDGSTFLVQELVEGCDLGALLRVQRERRRQLPLGVACHIAAELAAALACAHAARDDEGQLLGLVHRDVSPSNVLISVEGDVKLGDFGIAKAVASIEDALTRTHAVKGKLAYLSPEQAHGQPVDHRSDLFSLGCVLFECLTLRPAFPQVTDLASLERLGVLVPAPSSLRAEVPAELDALVLQLLSNAPAERPGSAAELAAALTRWVAELRGGPLPLRPLVVEARAAGRLGREGDSRLSWKRTRRLDAVTAPTRRRVAFLAAALAALLVTIGMSARFAIGRARRARAPVAAAAPSTTPAPRAAPALAVEPTTASPVVGASTISAIPRASAHAAHAFSPVSKTHSRTDGAPAPTTPARPTSSLRSSDIIDPFHR